MVVDRAKTINLKVKPMEMITLSKTALFQDARRYTVGPRGFVNIQIPKSGKFP